MIRSYSGCDKEHIEKLVKNDKLQNVYLYIDIQTYGFWGENIKTFLAEENGEIVAVIYFYHNSVQLFEASIITEMTAKEIADFLIWNQIRRISGKISLIQKLRLYIGANCVETDGYIMKYVPQNALQPLTACFAEDKNFEEIAKLIYDDPHLGSGYEYKDLLFQLRSRFLYDGCENVCIKRDGKIVSHFATYAVTKELAVLSGMVTAPEYRGLGYGSLLVRFLSEHIISDGKLAILYCYQEEYYSWYQKLGYKRIETSAKLEINYQ